MVSVEVSLYPLTPNYDEPVKEFIRKLKAHGGLQVYTNELSTQLTGEFQEIMKALTVAMEPTVKGEATCSFVIKLLNVGITPGTEVVV